MKKWFVYILKCRDGSLYTGITTNINRRLMEHNSGKGAKSLLGKLPVKIVYQDKYPNRSEAGKREAEIKGWKRKDKLKLISKAR